MDADGEALLGGATSLARVNEIDAVPAGFHASAGTLVTCGGTYRLSGEWLYDSGVTHVDIIITEGSVLSINPEIQTGAQLDVTIDSDGCMCPGPPAPPNPNCNEHGKLITGWCQGSHKHVVATPAADVNGTHNEREVVSMTEPSDWQQLSGSTRRAQ
jgi:hypothetical protein